MQRRQWRPTPVLLPGKSHGWRSQVGCSPWGCEESGTTERLPFRFSLACIGEGNGNPLQCSCLENPRDGRAWWAAVYGVTQSRTHWSDLAAAVCKYEGAYRKIYISEVVKEGFLERGAYELSLKDEESKPQWREVAMKPHDWIAEDAERKH